MTLSLSLILPTRERADYLKHALRTCLANQDPSLRQIVVLDNASADHTAGVVSQCSDKRIHYVRNESRLSMRDNFEKGIGLADGDVLCTLGDDDGVFPDAARRVREIFERHDVEAVAAARAHYFWPDLLSGRRNTALLPRHRKTSVHASREVLATLLDDSDYYRLPCIYHGFVRRRLVDRVRERQGRIFLSSQVDMYSAIALSMENVAYAWSNAPLIVNGASSRSNGASAFGGGAATERLLWKKEDDIGFLPGFEGSLSVAPLIIESALRYCAAHPEVTLAQIFPAARIAHVLGSEARLRRAAGRSEDDAEAPLHAAMAVLGPQAAACGDSTSSAHDRGRLSRLARSFLRSRPIDMRSRSVTDVFAAASSLQKLMDEGRTGLLDQPAEQVRVALQIARG